MMHSLRKRGLVGAILVIAHKILVIAHKLLATRANTRFAPTLILLPCLFLHTVSHFYYTNTFTITQKWFDTRATLL